MSSAKDFSCIGGLEKHIRVVKETVLFPLMYGDVYAKFNLKPPRGLLFYGPPGTGKTLVASALAVECSNSERKVSFISRKGSDCLSKWVGESEKKLQKIFSLAQQSKPCIIFFDEVDGLAPVRSSRQDFVHASIVSTLLALMDGLENNSEIIVIGATNRIDAIDPALRRPGRFDRELYFPLPCYNARKEILLVHIKTWKHKPPQKFLAYLASKTVGFCGSDLQALCAEAVMCCVRRNYPEIYTSKAKYQISERHLKVEKQDFLKARQNIVPASHRVSVAPVKSLSFKIQPLLQDNLSRILSQLEILCPTGMLICDVITGRAPSRSTSCPRILLCGNDDSHTRHLGPALLHTLEHLPCHVLDVTTLFEETGKAAEEAIIQVASLFDKHRGEMFEIVPPAEQERESFFKQLFIHSADDIESNQSSQVDYRQIETHPKKAKEGGKKRKSILQANCSENSTTQDASLSRRPKLGMKTRNKLCTVRSTQLTSRKSKINIKRKTSASGEGPLPKRSRNTSAGSLSASSNEKLNDSQSEELLQKITTATEAWSCLDLETLYASLELVFEKTEDGLHSAVEECLKQFQELKRTKVHVKKEES
ncbi:ATPase family AAA domain-containing protein 2-like [Nomia melanderi]|uniref:ATPase family AAA domain-containing protein 2-like n=1 Tax=Nomia melanderi TaxID=2448451 RepID=UPI003FCC5A8B